MELAVISDCHIGVRGSAADDFGGVDKERQLHLFIEECQRNMITPIAAGDLFELWQFGLDEILRSRPQLQDIISNFGYIIRGNHDRGLPYELFGVPVVDSLSFGDTKIIHGDQLDIFNGGRLGWIGKVVTKIGKIGEVGVNSKIDDYFSYAGLLLQRIFSLGHYSKARVYCGRAVDYIDDHEDIETLIFGHTHQFIYGGPLVYNTGSWIGNNNDVIYTEVDENA